jgi:signal-transduction protein with cAMP-binding, CBS, and nucleotidyltransferase domain
MNAEPFAYPHARQLTLAGCLALVTLGTAVIYACHSNPFTMVLFLGLGSTLLMAAVTLFGWTIWKDLRARLDSIVTRQFAPGQVIFRPGDPADHVFLITKGQVEAVYADPAKGDVILGRLGPEEYFGETAILSRLPRQIASRAVDAVELLAIHRTDFLRLYSSLPRLRARIQAQQPQRLALARQAGLTNLGH